MKASFKWSLIAVLTEVSILEVSILTPFKNGNNPNLLDSILLRLPRLLPSSVSPFLNSSNSFWNSLSLKNISYKPSTIVSKEYLGALIHFEAPLSPNINTGYHP